MSYPPPPDAPQYAGGAPAPSGKQRLRGRTPLRLSIVFFVIAIACFVVGGIILATKSLSKVDDFQRVDLGSSGSVTFDNTGNYIAYYEADNVTSDTTSVPRIPIRLQAPSGSAQVLTTPYGGRNDNKVKILTYQYGGHNGVALYQFKITKTGRYNVQVGSNTQAASGANIAFGTSIAGGLVLGVVLIVVGVVVIIVAIVLLIVGLVKRGRHKRELRNPYGGNPYGGPGYGGPPPGYPPPGYPSAGSPSPGGPYPGGPPPGYNPSS